MNELQRNEYTDIMENYQKSDNILNDIQIIIETSQKEAYRTVDIILTRRRQAVHRLMILRCLLWRKLPLAISSWRLK
jgi:hypothetical protein